MFCKSLPFSTQPDSHSPRPRLSPSHPRTAPPLPPINHSGTKIPVIAQQKKALKLSISKTVSFWSEHKTPETEKSFDWCAGWCRSGTSKVWPAGQSWHGVIFYLARGSLTKMYYSWPASLPRCNFSFHHLMAAPFWR